MAVQGRGDDFWSRRRAAVRAEAKADADSDARRHETGSLIARDVAEAKKTDADLLEELGLPDPDALVAGDDFAAFMHAAVPERLRRRALRKLWTSNPVLANLDGLVDHGEDFSDAATVVPGMVTTYQVGKGLMEHVRKLAAAGAVDAAGDADGITDVDGDRRDDIVVAHDDTHRAVEEGAADEEPAPEPPAPRRHMRFVFEG